MSPRMEVRNPKAEGRRKSENRSPNISADLTHRTRPRYQFLAQVSDFGFRISAFPRPSTFGLRTFVVALVTLFALALIAAEPNGTSDLPPSSLKPPRGEIVPGFWEQHGMLIIVAGILILAILAAGIWFLLRPKPPVPVPLGTQAREQLERLSQQPENGALLSKTSHILHGYIVAVFGLPAEEHTTSEFCQAISRNQDIGAELSNEISEFLHACDISKFSPMPQQPLGAVSRCRAIIDHAETRLTDLHRERSASQSPPTASLQRESAQGMTSRV